MTTGVATVQEVAPARVPGWVAWPLRALVLLTTLLVLLQVGAAGSRLVSRPGRRVSRRRFVGLAGATGFAAAAGLGAAGCDTLTTERAGALLTSRLPLPPQFAVPLPMGTTELWTLTSDFHHPVHIHLGHFQVYRRNGKDPGPDDAGWKDTVDLRPFEVVEPTTWSTRT